MLGQPAVGRSYAVFDGVVVGKRVTIGNAFGAFYPHNEVTFAVANVWKGNRVPSITLLEDGSDCDYRFSAGRRYVVFADGYRAERDLLSASGCNPTTEIDGPARYERIVEAIGEPVLSFAAPSALPSRFDRARYLCSAYLLAGVAVAANIATHGTGVADLYSSADPVWPILIGAVLAILFIGSAIVWRRRRAGVLFAAATIASSVLALVVAGFIYIEHTASGYAPHWESREAQSPAPPPPR